MKKIFYILLVLPFMVSAQDQARNYIKNTTYKVPTTVSLPTPTITQAAVNVTYVDGLGRPTQQIARGQSGTGKDIITPIVYDGFGRQAKDFLPYPLQNSSMAYDTNYAANQQSYYTATYGAAQTNAYSEKILENSPLGRILEQGAPGIDWKANPSSDADHTIKFEYGSNVITPAAEQVKLYTATATWDNTLEMYGTILANPSGTLYYAVNTLYKTVTKDENWTTGRDNTTEEYKDRKGQVVLKRAFENSVPHDTYYVYDKFGNLTYVIPPLVLGTVTTAVLDGLCYQYRYDARNRLVEKKLPGKQWEFIVYDKLDRVVATGPANSPFTDGSGSINAVGWLVTKYDAFNRPVITGFLPVIGRFDSTIRKSLQAARNTQTADFSETKATADIMVMGVPVRYNNLAFPTGTTSYSVLTVNYYDDYNYTGAPTDFTSLIEGQAVYYNNTTKKPRGFSTGSWIRVCGTSGEVNGELSSTLYGEKGRVLRTKKLNYMGLLNQVDTNQDAFTGRINYTVTTQGGNSIKDSFTYTDQDRPLTHIHQINTTGIPQLLSKNEYDEMGQLSVKNVGGNDIETFFGMQQVGYRYNIRGWLTDINNVDNLVQPEDVTADNFAFRINYNTVANTLGGQVKALYNGNISETFWKSSEDITMRSYGYSYDNLNRLRNAYYQKPGQSVPLTHSYDESMSYDRNGNITSLQRNGEFDDANFTLQTDDLLYSYLPNTNKLSKVVDRSTSPAGFKDDSLDGVNDPDDDYQYDANGNMTRDYNKGIITDIIYNHLNQPLRIVFNGDATKKIEYIYRATGEKIRKTVTDGTVIMVTDYQDGFQYSNNVLKFFVTSEGYVSYTPPRSKGQPATYNYVFNYTDHLGNVRLSYGYGLDKNGFVIMNMSENNYYPFGMKHQNYNMTQLEYQDVGGVVTPYTSLNPFYKYKYNGKEFQDELGLNMTAMDYRQYDSAIGRFNTIDPLSELFVDMSPFAFAFNNPVVFSDPSGLCPECEKNVKDPQNGQIFNTSGASYTYNNGQWTRTDAENDLEEVKIVTEKKSSNSSSTSDGTAGKKEGTMLFGLIKNGDPNAMDDYRTKRANPNYNPGEDKWDRIFRLIGNSHYEIANDFGGGGYNMFGGYGRALKAFNAAAYAEEIINLNKATEGGGSLLSSTPQAAINSAMYYPTNAQKGASIFRSIISNHMFIDGNKRTAVAAFELFAQQHGLKTVGNQQMMNVATQVATGEVTDVAQIAKLLVK